MKQANPPLDAQGEKLLDEVERLLEKMLVANTGTALSVGHTRLRDAVERLAHHRYAQIGVSEPEGVKK